MIEVFADAMVVIILQYINVSSQLTAHLKLMTMLYVNYMSIKLNPCLQRISSLGQGSFPKGKNVSLKNI